MFACNKIILIIFNNFMLLQRLTLHKRDLTRFNENVSNRLEEKRSNEENFEFIRKENILQSRLANLIVD